MSLLIQQSIAEEVKEAGMYSVQLDTTQDLTSKNQCAIVLRYLTDVINEKLIAVIDCQTGQNLVVLLKKVLGKLALTSRNALATQQMGLQTCKGSTRDFLHFSDKRHQHKSMFGVMHIFLTLCWQTQLEL